MQPSDNAHDCGCGGQCGSQPSRRDFLKLAGATTAALGAATAVGANAAEPRPIAPTTSCPSTRSSSRSGSKALFAKGRAERLQRRRPEDHRHADRRHLRRAAVPGRRRTPGALGHLQRGPLHRLRRRTTTASAPSRSPLLDQGFAVQVTATARRPSRTLDAKGFPGVRFCGEYPIGRVEYADEELPVAVTLEAFSPFIPLERRRLGPAGHGDAVHGEEHRRQAGRGRRSAAGWRTACACTAARRCPASCVNERRAGEGVDDGRRHGEGRAAAQGSPPAAIVLADFEGDDYGEWKAEGEAFGKGPAKGTLPGQQAGQRFPGQGAGEHVPRRRRAAGQAHLAGVHDRTPFLSFLVGGGNHEGQDLHQPAGRRQGRPHGHGQGRREAGALATGTSRELAGKEARIEIVDQASGPWGHINVDQIELRDAPQWARPAALERQPDFGTMGLAVLDGGKDVFAGPTADCPTARTACGRCSTSATAAAQPRSRSRFGRSCCGGAGQAAVAQAGPSRPT